ncbi:hypothetical protein LSM04_008452 [Trypanosoma melophagium]|uniref:uncharacterized protein n=1 Tax=Trypanosoma melophagium TaxID=715481 RepID=UPI00351A03B8|nr:hypothetical protein LSM04_008452 [Trypanosoma melophagium]
MAYKLLDAEVFLSVVVASKKNEAVGIPTATLKLVLEALPRKLDHQEGISTDATCAAIDTAAPIQTLGELDKKTVALRLSHAELYQRLAELEDVAQTLRTKGE